MCLLRTCCETVPKAFQCSPYTHTSTPTSPGRPGFRLIDSLPFPPQRRPAVPTPSSQTTRESLFVIHELVRGLGYRPGGRDRGNRKTNKRTKLVLIRWMLTRLFVYYSGLAAQRFRRAMERAIEAAAEVINGHLCLPLPTSLPPPSRPPAPSPHTEM